MLRLLCLKISQCARACIFFQCSKCMTSDLIIRFYFFSTKFVVETCQEWKLLTIRKKGKKKTWRKNRKRIGILGKGRAELGRQRRIRKKRKISAQEQVWKKMIKTMCMHMNKRKMLLISPNTNMLYYLLFVPYHLPQIHTL